MSLLRNEREMHNTYMGTHPVLRRALQMHSLRAQCDVQVEVYFGEDQHVQDPLVIQSQQRHTYHA